MGIPLGIGYPGLFNFRPDLRLQIVPIVFNRWVNSYGSAGCIGGHLFEGQQQQQGETVGNNGVQHGEKDAEQHGKLNGHSAALISMENRWAHAGSFLLQQPGVTAVEVLQVNVHFTDMQAQQVLQEGSEYAAT